MRKEKYSSVGRLCPISTVSGLGAGRVANVGKGSASCGPLEGSGQGRQALPRLDEVRCGGDRRRPDPAIAVTTPELGRQAYFRVGRAGPYLGRGKEIGLPSPRNAGENSAGLRSANCDDLLISR